MTIPKLKHIRFNKTQKKNQNNSNNSNIYHIFRNFTRNRKTIKPRKRIIFPLHYKNNTRKKNSIYTYNKSTNNSNNSNNSNNTTNNAGKNRIIMPRFTIKRKMDKFSRNSMSNNIRINNLDNYTINNNIYNNNNNNNNNNNINAKQLLLKRYFQIKRRKMTTFKNENNYNNKRTPIYNSYVPGSGVGASNIATRRHKQKYAYLH